jgi:hypothetical protein
MDKENLVHIRAGAWHPSYARKHKWEHRGLGCPRNKEKPSLKITKAKRDGGMADGYV